MLLHPKLLLTLEESSFYHDKVFIKSKVLYIQFQIMKKRHFMNFFAKIYIHMIDLEPQQTSFYIFLAKWKWQK